MLDRMAMLHAGVASPGTGVNRGLKGWTGAVVYAAAALCTLAACSPGVESVAQNQRTAAPAQAAAPTPSGTAQPATSRPLRVVVIGDSLSTGYGTSPAQAWPGLLGEDLQSGQPPVQVITAAANGSGYLAAGDGGETFMSEIEGSVDESADIVILFGSDNDFGADPADLRTAISDTLVASKILAPHAARIVVGPLAAFDPDEDDLQVIRDQEQGAALDAGVMFVDPILEQWVSSPDSPLLGPDGEHPSIEGQQFLYDKLKSIVVWAAPAQQPLPST
jgi:lysophospholipase L1-like esterase